MSMVIESTFHLITYVFLFLLRDLLKNNRLINIVNHYFYYYNLYLSLFFDIIKDIGKAIIPDNNTLYIIELFIFISFINNCIMYTVNTSYLITLYYMYWMYLQDASLYDDIYYHKHDKYNFYMIEYGIY